MSSRRSGRRGPLLLGAWLAATAVLSAACGTRLDHSAVVAASGGQALGGSQGGTQGGSGTAGDSGSGGPANGSSAATSSGAVGPVATDGSKGRAGSTTSSSARVRQPGSSAAVAVPRGAPVVIASVGDYSGISGASEKDGPKALQIWASWINGHGGLKGHPVRVYVVDDGMDPQRYQAAVKDLVENKHVIAFVANFAPFTIQSGVKYLESKNIPVVGGDCAEYVWNESRMLFPQCPSYVSGTYGIVRTGAVYGKGKKFGAVICSEAAACSSTKTEWFDHGQAKSAGLDPVFESDISIGQPDFTAECLDAQRAGVQILSVVADVGTVGRLVASCERQGFHPQYLQPSGTMDAHVASLPGMADALVQLNDFAWTVKGNPAVDEFQAAYRTYAPDDPLTPIASQGWASAKLFERAAAGIDSTPTTAQVLAGLWSLRKDTIGGLTPPLTFLKGQPAVDAKCSFSMQVKGGRLESPFGLRTVCR